MDDFIDYLARDARKTLENGYYKIEETSFRSKISLRESIENTEGNPVISEIKTASPSRGTIRTGFDVIEVAKAMESGGAAGISVLTEPMNFGGDLRFIQTIKESVRIPVLMKDIILDLEQVKAASSLRADAILLIKAVFDRGYCNHDLNEMIHQAQRLGLEVLLETHTLDEFLSAIQSEAGLIGINNRDLRDLQVNLGVTESILKKNNTRGKIIVSESGITTPQDLLFLKSSGAHAFLIGSSIMASKDIKDVVRRFVTA
jgi:indole-3-glycerol phosphate synthase